MPISDVVIRPLTPSRFADLERVFESGDCARCWCMWFRLSQREVNAGWGEGNRRRLKQLVVKRRPVGVIAYLDGEPAGWCAVAPRRDQPRLARSPVAFPLNDDPVWSVTCLVVHPKARGRGLTAELLRGAENYAASRGARILESYPKKSPAGRISSASAYVGLESMFAKAGWTAHDERRNSRLLMRKLIRRRRDR